MRSATKEERESVDRYIESISHKTGIVCAAGDVDYEDDFDFYGEHPKADMSKVNRIRVSGKVFIAADELLKNIDAFAAGVEAYKTGRDGEIDFMKKDGILAGLSMARFFVERLKGGEQE